jgi:hypothetical protein
MAEALEYEKTDKHGDPIKRLTAGTTPTVRPPRKSRQAKKQHIDTTEVGASSDEDDRDYQDTEPVESKSTSPSEGDCQDTLPSNAEASSLLHLFVFILTHAAIYTQVADILPSKTIPAVGRGAPGKRTRSKPTAPFEIQPISRTASACSNNELNETCEKVSKQMVR